MTDAFNKTRLYAENEDLKQRIAELEKERPIRDLEQQAKGVESIDLVEFMQIAFRHIDMPDFHPADIKDAFKFLAHDLRQKAAKLKEQGNDN